MKDAIKLFRKLLPPYKGLIGLNIFFNALGAIFGIFSFITLIPILRILLDKATEVPASIEINWGVASFDEIKDGLINNAYAYLGNMANETGVFKTLIIISTGMILMVMLKTGFTFLASYMMVITRNNVVKDIRNKMYKKILELPIGFFSKEKKGDIIARITNDVLEVEHSVMTSLDMFFKNPILIIAALVSMIIISWQLTLFVFILFPIAGALIGYIGKTLKRKSLKGQNKMGEILSTVEETIGGLKIIKAFNAEKAMTKKQKGENSAYRLIMNSLMTRHQLAHPSSEFLGTAVMLIVMNYGAKLILSGTGSLDFEIFIAYLIMFYSIINPAKAFSSAFYSIQKGLASMDRINHVMDTVNTITNPDKPEELKDFKESIEYKDVWFKYAEDYVLKGINLKVEKGKTIALVGQSGSGKSTMVDLLPRFYDVTKGSITIDGKDVKSVLLHDLRHLFGIVSQDPILFNDTIFNNIAFGMEDVSEEQVVHAAKVANAHEFIEKTENGYQTNIGDRGSKLSGGQRQRLSIARAILKNPPIMILDEATSALDTESERLVQDALTKLMENRTSLVIAHRLSTIVHADEICVLKDGEIVERGKHEELLKNAGEYQKFYELQNFK